MTITFSDFADRLHQGMFFSRQLNDVVRLVFRYSFTSHSIVYVKVVPEISVKSDFFFTCDNSLLLCSYDAYKLYCALS